MAKKMMPISSRWFQGAIVTYLIGFTVLGILAYLVYRDQPPLPARVMAGDKAVFTRDDIMSGMNVFQRNGLMEYGSIYGHGAYLGPDFTAEYLHKTAEFLAKRYQGAPVSGVSARDRVAAELHENTYNPIGRYAALERAESRGARNDGRVLSILLPVGAKPRWRPSKLDRGSRRHSAPDGIFCLDCLDSDGEPARQELLLHEQLAARAAGRKLCHRRCRHLERHFDHRSAWRHGLGFLFLRTLRLARLG